MRYKFWAGVGASILLGLIFLASGLGKLLSQEEFLTVIIPKTFLTPFMANLVAHWLPWVEVVLGFLLIFGIASKLMASLSTVLTIAFIVNNSWLISHGLGYEPCGCFGTFERMFLGELSTIESLYLDIGLLALIAVIWLFYPRNPLAIRPWFIEKPGTTGNE